MGRFTKGISVSQRLCRMPVKSASIEHTIILTFEKPHTDSNAIIYGSEELESGSFNANSSENGEEVCDAQA